MNLLRFWSIGILRNLVSQHPFFSSSFPLPFKHTLVIFYGFLNNQALPLNLKSQLHNVPKRPPADSHDRPLTVSPAHSSCLATLGPLRPPGLMCGPPWHRVVLCALTVLLDPLSSTHSPQTSQSLLSPYEASLDVDLISLLPQHPGTGGNPTALVINDYPFICRFMCLSSISSHWTLTSREGGRREGRRHIFRLSLGPPVVWKASLLDKRASKRENSVNVAGVSVKKTEA